MVRTKTESLIMELDRCRMALVPYRNQCIKKNYYNTKEHASAKRATLDLSRLLSKWREGSIL